MSHSRSSSLARGAAALAAAALLAACALGSGGWESGYERDHPLVGKIWDVASGEFVDEARLMEALAKQRFALVGEKHDNPDHHRLQARVVEALARGERKPVVAFEMLAADVAAELAEATAEDDVTAEKVRVAVRWDASGWPPFELYAPVFDAALAAKLPLATANLPKGTLESLSKSGLEGLDARVREELALEPPLSPPERAVMAAHLREAHCGRGDAARLERMVDVQTARDAWMAAALLAVASYPGTDGGVLIAGNEHVRRDRGVARYLLRRDPEATVATLAIIEVTKDETDPRAALDLDPGAASPFDFAWFTPRSDERDPCERFREELERVQEPTASVVD
jgi:uncharacterized iron-regulated protein